MRHFLRRFILLLLLALGANGSALSQTLDELRESLRESLHDAQTAGSLAGLIVMADEFELSGARYWIDNDFDTELTSLALPYRNSFQPWAAPWPGIYLEGVLGYAKASDKTDDIYSGQAPALATAVDSKLTTYSVLLGLGPQWQIWEGFSVALIANGGAAWMESDARYGGPGAAFSALLLNGLIFNWDGYTVSGGGAVRLDYIRLLGKAYKMEIATRFDARWTQSAGADDPALEFTSRADFFTLRGDIVGPTGLQISGQPLTWRSTAGCRVFVEGDMYDISAMGMIGGALELDTDNTLPLGPTVSLSAGFMFGDRVLGYTLGLGLSF